MSSDFTSRKLSWLETLARDRTLPRSAIALAVLLACRYFNGESGEAWPSERTLAGDTGMTPANVHIGIERLVAAGVLRRRSGGPRTPSRYSIPRRWKAPERYYGQERSAIVGNSTSGIAGNSAEPLRAIAEPGNEPENRTREGTPRRPRRSDQGGVSLGSTVAEPPRRPRRRRRTVPGRRGHAAPLPRGWECQQAELTAAREVAGWQPERARAEFAKFVDWHSKRGNRSADWHENWKTWCTKGSEIDTRDRERTQPRKDRARAGVVGVARWYEKQKAAAAYVIPAREDEA